MPVTASLLRAVALTLACAMWSIHVYAGSFFERDGAAIKGYDPVAYFHANKAVPGVPAYQAEYKGSKFQFASQANRDAFVADPATYAPQYDGFCAFGTAGGYKAAIDPAAFTIVGGKLYLNYNAEIQKKWSGDVPGYISKADKNWPAVEKTTKVFE